MGICVTRVRPNWYTVCIKTGDYKGSGTDSNVTLRLYNASGSSPAVKLDCTWSNDFERGSLDTFYLKKTGITAAVEEIELTLSEGSKCQNWFVETIEVKHEDLPAYCGSIFPFHRWIRQGETFRAARNDSFLPEHDPNRKQRLDELARKKQIYQLERKFKGELAIAQVVQLPDEQEFSNKYFFDVLARQAAIYEIDTLTTYLTTDNWETLDDIIKVYNKTLPIPYGVDNWRSDESFANQRLNGCNPCQIRLCTEIPANLAVTDNMMKPLLEGMSIQEAIQSKKLFIVNYSVLKDIQTTDNRIVCAPIALFFLNQSKTLMPVAIQLYQEPSSDNPVFLPTDPEYTWMLAKLWFNNADGAVHESVAHLGFTHLISETMAVAANRCLSPSHPIYKLLAPHFLYVMAINSFALVTLIDPGGIVDKNINAGSQGFVGLVQRVFPEWRLGVEGSLPEDLRSRGVDDPDVLPGYHYRDDALLLHGAIKRYAAFVVNKRYDTPELLSGDSEIQEFAETLVKPIENGGCGIKGVAGNGRFSANHQLIDVLTSIIFISSVQHAAVNFNQYDEYAFPPNAPLWMNGTPPKDKTPRTEHDILQSLPNKKRTLDTMSFTRILSERATRRLGNFEKIYQTDPVGKEAVAEFLQELFSIEETIASRDAKRNVRYPYLNPREIPNAISI
ncbi:arachidonate 5-lipoxygenase-like [Acanthaster planci]|uniref:Arachidonate 5-lipoxygenase-like n=1 Tax=Acanthaster planci TaxID=133434 RepID=A0A8B7XVU1_ACAPL|nr:arachidonate 5-lipoxygenase-like [Acanthaster planci]XP_022085831.1 arachidonate 5-lipoxygenase-like [Acanthaster planci]XP_022086665.1 arachidonate 5-lipoxygenase-like [Acanthaster planci]XP_022087509.1 arachidonate 5-lipoxygenase-like [Acanthaster planci]